MPRNQYEGPGWGAGRGVAHSFLACALTITFVSLQISQHYSKPRVTPVEVMPVFPDFKVRAQDRRYRGIIWSPPPSSSPTCALCPLRCGSTHALRSSLTQTRPLRIQAGLLLWR